MTSSLLDTDFYKLTMQEAVRRLYPDTEARYELILRGEAQRFDETCVAAIRDRLNALSELALTGEETRWLTGLGMLSEDYIQFLKSYRFNPKEQLQVRLDDEGRIHAVAEGPWKETILWETPLLAIVCEEYFNHVVTDWEMSPDAYFDRSLDKARACFRHGCAVTEFGTRRRRNLAFQEAVIRAFLLAAREFPQGAFLGTSNLHLARKYDIPPTGTTAHEWIMAHAAMFGVDQANAKAFRSWLDAHDGRHAIALADTYTHDLFFRDFSKDLASAYTGVRHDSGDPISFGHRLERHFRSFGINSSEKILVFSDGLDVDRTLDLHFRFRNRFKCAYGIGTFLTNDVPGSPPLDIVMKMTALNGKPVVKLGDHPAKSSGDPATVAAARRAVEKRLGHDSSSSRTCH